jgi:hypothetical protein
MKKIRRSRMFVLLPGITLVILGLDLIWDVIKSNLNAEVVRQWPWRFGLLDITSCATLIGLIAGLLLTRAQFSKSMTPAVGWRGSMANKSARIPRAAWTVFLYNYGTGNCRVIKIQYSYTLSGRAPSSWETWDVIVKKLAEEKMIRNRDYYLRNIGIGFTIPIDSTDRRDSELAAFTIESLARLSSLDVALEVEDMLGDTYGRTIECLHTAHENIKFRYANDLKTNRFRRRWSLRLP